MTILKIYLGDKNVAEILKESFDFNDDYIKHLVEADDWTMMILSWALLEASLNFAICKTLNNKTMEEHVEQLSISGRTGKASLAKSLGLISKEDLNFIHTYSRVRNSFAHGVKRFKTTFEDYFASLANDDAKKFKTALFITASDSQSPRNLAFENDKRDLIFMHVVSIIVKLAKTE